MLSSPRWTSLDSCLMIAAIAVLARLFDGAPQPGLELPPDQETRQRALVELVMAPLPDGRAMLAMNQRRRLDAVLRCSGLREAAHLRNCPDCRPSLTPVATMQGRLAVRNPEGPFAQAMRSRIARYAAAYALLDDAGGANSQLILRRDSAMCNRYPEFREAGLHEQQDRQSRRSVQEGAG